VNRRLSYAIACLVVIALGLLSRKHPGMFPAVLGKYPGDALWALMVFCIVGFFQPYQSIAKQAAYALLISYADEFSQLYQAPWINQIRAKTIGHLVLGSAFSWFDILAYTVGVAVGVGCRLILAYAPTSFLACSTTPSK
jgi:hypothetical protein